MALRALPLGYIEPPLRDHCNFTEHKTGKPPLDYSYKYLGYISFFLALFRFNYDILFKTAVSVNKIQSGLQMTGQAVTRK